MNMKRKIFVPMMPCLFIQSIQAVDEVPLSITNRYKYHDSKNPPFKCVPMELQ